QGAIADVGLEKVDVGVGALHRGDVIEHQQHAGNGQAEEKEEAQATQAIGVSDLYVRLVDAGGVKVEEDVCRHHQHLVAGRVRVAGAKDRLPDVVVKDLVVDEPEYAGALWSLSTRARPLSYRHSLPSSAVHCRYLDHQLPTTTSSARLRAMVPKTR